MNAQKTNPPATRRFPAESKCPAGDFTDDSGAFRISADPGAVPAQPQEDLFFGEIEMKIRQYP